MAACHLVPSWQKESRTIVCILVPAVLVAASPIALLIFVTPEPQITWRLSREPHLAQGGDLQTSGLLPRKLEAEPPGPEADDYHHPNHEPADQTDEFHTHTEAPEFGEHNHDDILENAGAAETSTTTRLHRDEWALGRNSSGNHTDSGGDGCNWYALAPQLCGCCDDDDFTSVDDCQSECSGGNYYQLPVEGEDATTLEAALDGFPTKTTVLRLSGKSIYGVILGTLPDLFPKLKILNLSNNLLEGPIPDTLWTLPLTELSLANNTLSGQIGDKAGSLNGIVVLELGNNQLDGSLPGVVGAWTSLRHLNLARNSLTGRVPPAVSAWANLESVNLEGNHFSGGLPKGIVSWTHVREVRLRGNVFSGFPMDGDIISPFWRSVQVVDISNNDFSEHIPHVMAYWHNLREIDLSGNRFAGAFPHFVSNWKKVQKVFFQQNSLASPVPEGVGSWQEVLQVNFSDNHLVGYIPSSICNWTNIKAFSASFNLLTGFSGQVGCLHHLNSLDLSNNKFSGAFRDVQALHSLSYLSLSGNGITEIQGLPRRMRGLRLAHNSLTVFPEAITGLQFLEVLELQGNRIAQWPSSARSLSAAPCSFHAPSISWRQLVSLNVSHNPLGVEMETFIQSLAHLEHLTTLSCRHCHVTGYLQAPIYSQGLADNTAKAVNASCVDAPKWIVPAFAKLQSLDLAGNMIEGILAKPSPALARVDLSGNDLFRLDRSWFNEDGTNSVAELSLHDNLRLRVPVAWPHNNCSLQPALTADPSGYEEFPGGFACTRLCPGRYARYTADSTLNSSAMCRCQAGHAGIGAGCSACPVDTYSKKMDPAGLVRKCTVCPRHSSTVEGMADDISACKCVAGSYLNRTMEACLWCPQYPFRTTQVSGQVLEVACGCNPMYNGLKEFSGLCGCDEGKYMNHADRTCQPCNHAENCAWGIEPHKSIDPPLVKAGYWAQPVSNMTAFRKNDIWRCAGKKSCGAGGVCAVGREGLACSRCKPRMYGKPNGPCQPCPDMPLVSQRWLIAAVAIGLVPVPMILHMALASGQDGLLVLVHLRAIRGSLKQMVKHIQTVTVIGQFNVEWPAYAQAFFDALSRFTFSVPMLAAFGCTQQQSTVALELGAKWALPIVFAIMTTLAMLLSRPAARLAALGKRTCLRRIIPSPDVVMMGPWDVARVLLFTVVLFWSTIAANVMEVLTCIPGPNGEYTVATYPQVKCSFFNPEFAFLAFLTGLAFVMYIVCPLLVLRHGLYYSDLALARSDLNDRGWYSFLFDDYRDAHLYWAAKIMVKELMLVSIPVMMPGFGAAQLLSTAGLAITHTVLVMRASPFINRANTLLETWNGASAAALCIYSVGMGYQKTVGMEDVEELFQEGAEDPIYRGRAVGMVVVQGLAILIPATVLLFQLICEIPRTSRLVPDRFKPVTKEQMQAWMETFLASAGGMDDLALVLRAFDENDIYSFKEIFENTPATLGHALSKTSTSALVRLAEPQVGPRVTWSSRLSETIMTVVLRRTSTEKSSEDSDIKDGEAKDRASQVTTDSEIGEHDEEIGFSNIRDSESGPDSPRVDASGPCAGQPEEMISERASQRRSFRSVSGDVSTNSRRWRLAFSI